jgi:MFS family permease
MGVRRGLARGARGVRRSVRKEGAQESGLASMVELTFLSSAADALLAVTLAGSQFFSVPLGEARSRVALYLLSTMIPFALLAPVIGPLLDRVAHGRRVAIGAIMLGRAFLAWTLAGKLGSPLLYPLALGLLVLSRSYGVTRSAVVPRVLPPGGSLVRVNSRLSITVVIAATVFAPVGLGVGKVVGYGWTMRASTIVCLVAVLAAFNLPSHVDRAEGERPAEGLRKATFSGGWRVRNILGELPAALRSTAVLRALVGFLTLFLAFLLRQTGGTLTGLGALAAAATVGSAVGIFTGGRMKKVKPESILVISLVLALVACTGAAVDYTKVTALVAALLATMAGSLGKLALDAVIQRDVAEDARNSAFARSETVLQLSWVIGGAIGLAPVPGWVGFAFASVGVGLALGSEMVALRRVRERRRFAGADAGGGPGPPLGTAVAGAGMQPSAATYPGTLPAATPLPAVPPPVVAPPEVIPGTPPTGMPTTLPPSELPYPGRRR